MVPPVMPAPTTVTLARMGVSFGVRGELLRSSYESLRMSGKGPVCRYVLGDPAAYCQPVTGGIPHVSFFSLVGCHLFETLATRRELHRLDGDVPHARFAVPQ